MKTTITIMFALLMLGVKAQDIALLKTQIDSAKTYEEMPVLPVSATRLTGEIMYKLVDGEFICTKTRLQPNDTLTLYFPSYAKKLQNKSGKSNLVSTSPAVNENTLFVDYGMLMMNVDKDSRSLINAWSSKYLELLRNQPKESEKPYMITGSLPIWIVFSKQSEQPVKAYAAVEDCIHFINNTPYFDQQINLYYKHMSDSSRWSPNTYEILSDLNMPEPLTDKYLAKKTIYVAMQSNFNLAGKAFETLEECKAYADNYKVKYIEIPLFYRNRMSYDTINQIRKRRLGIK